MEAQDVEQRTTAQRDSAEWKKWHQCTITASNFKRVVSCSTVHKGLLKSMFDGVSLDHVKAVAHGQRHEADGVEAYKEQRGAEMRMLPSVHVA